MASSRQAPPHGVTCSMLPPGVPRSGAQQGEAWGTARLIQGASTATRPSTASTAGAASLLQLLTSPWRAWPDLSRCPSTAVTGGRQGAAGTRWQLRMLWGNMHMHMHTHAHTRTFCTRVYTRAHEHNTCTHAHLHACIHHTAHVHMCTYVYKYILTPVHTTDMCTH